MSAHRVRIVNGKIAEVNTGSPECVVPLPAQYLGRRLDSLLYRDGEWSDDPEYKEPSRPPAPFGGPPA